MSKISFIYFDVGGVVIKDCSGSNKWEELLVRMGISEKDLDKVDEIYNRHKHEINTTFDIDELVPTLITELGISLPKDYSWLDDTVACFEQNKELWPLLHSLNGKVRLGLLTNMWVRMFYKIIKADLFPPMKWDVVVDSSKVLMYKPNSDIYRYAQMQTGVDPNEILFIDNTPKNLLEPKALGWTTFLYDSSNYDKANQDLQKYLQTMNY